MTERARRNYNEMMEIISRGNEINQRLVDGQRRFNERKEEISNRNYDYNYEKTRKLDPAFADMCKDLGMF